MFDSNHCQTLVLFQVAATVRCYTPPQTFSLAICASSSALIIFIATCAQHGFLVLTSHQESLGSHSTSPLRIANLVVALAVCLTGFVIPRRPDLFYNGLPVDGMYTVSAWSRTNLSWAIPIVTLANNKQRLELDDFPNMDHKIRSEETSAAWISKERPRRLWWELCLDRRWKALRFYGLGCLTAVSKLGPNYAVYQIIRLLEARQAGEQMSHQQAWLWVFALLLSSYGITLLDQWTKWLGWLDMSFPIRAQLAALIFQKSMRRKDAKEPSKDDIDKASSSAQSERHSSQDRAEAPKTKQTVLNLIGVDCKRLADFLAMSFEIPSAIAQLITHSLFLVSILGWQALLAGYLMMSLLIPINIKYSKGYCTAQLDLMKVRDVKMGVVTEVLQGMPYLTSNERDSS